MTEYTVRFDEDYDNDPLTQADVESKGWFDSLRFEFQGRTYWPHFYDPVRFLHDREHQLAHGQLYCFEPNVVIVPRVTREEMLRALDGLAESEFSGFVPDDAPLS